MSHALVAFSTSAISPGAAPINVATDWYTASERARDRIGSRVPADACFQLEVFDHRVDDHTRWERGARVVEMHHVAAPGRVGPDSCDVDQQALST